MDRIKKVTHKLKKSLNADNTPLYLITGGSILLAGLFLYGNMRNARGITDFLIEKGIDPNEYWLTPEDFSSINS